MTPPEPRHWLVIPQSAGDDVEVEHPGCPTRPGDHSDPGHEYVQYACDVGDVGEQEAYAGLPWRHRDTPGLLVDSTGLAPGRYPIAYVPDGDRSGLVLLAEEPA